MMWIYLFSVWFLIKFAAASNGDRSPYYQRCVEKCEIQNCTREGYFAKDNQPIYLRLSLWFCKDECKYDCMWKTVDHFHKSNYTTPQFHGKWPFIRILGIQEPASTVFSLLNLYAHLIMFTKFQNEVQPDSPLYATWKLYAMICCHAWFWSTIFHWRDTDTTEFFDYLCAFSIILINGHVMAKRVLMNYAKYLDRAITVFFAAMFLNHAMYLNQGNFDYTYNMQLNIFIGTCTAACWFIWCLRHRFEQPYVWKCGLYVALTIFVLLLEVIDHPPFFYIFDSHALWHLATAPLVVLIYSFAIDDCKYLRKLMNNNDDQSVTDD